MTRIVVLVIGLAVLVVGAVSLTGSVVPGAAVSEQITESFLMTPGESLRVQTANGRLTYEAWDGDEVVIEATRIRSRFMSDLIRRFWGEATVTIERTDGGVEATAEWPRRLFGGNWHDRVQFHVKVPRGWHGVVDLRTSNGAIVASDIHGDVSVRTSNGAITLTGHEGTLVARTSNGPIRLSDVHGKVEARTTNGPVRLLGGTLTETGLLRTSNGAVELRARLEPSADYEVTTSNGAVTVTLIDPNASVELRTSNGNINLQTEVKASAIERNRVVGTVGDGDARLNVRTSNGSVTLSALQSN